MLKALIKRDPDALAIVRQSFKGKIEEFIHRS